MTDYIYNSITEMPDDVLLGNIRTFENVITNIRKRKGNVEAIENMKLAIQRWKDELARRQDFDKLNPAPDSLYVTNSDGTVELVDDMGEIK